MSLFAPRIITINIPVDKIGEVIGPKGKVINQIQDDTGAQISIEDDGTIYVGADSGEKAEAARSMINAIANPTMPERGERYLGTVVKITAFGAFVSLLPGQGRPAAHLQAASARRRPRVESVEDVLSVGQKLQVEISDIDDRGKLSLDPRGRGAGRRLSTEPVHRPPRGAVPDQDGAVRRTVLPHGLTVVSERMASSRTFCVGDLRRRRLAAGERGAPRGLALPRARPVQGHASGAPRSRSRPRWSRAAAS